MIKSFGNKLAHDLVEERVTKEFRAFPAELVRTARKKLLNLHAANDVKDLSVPPGNRLHKLKGNMKSRHAISINDQWRVSFVWADGNAFDVKVEDYHS
ncbi:type II toxin-antitoxin system RelE/ParE family toxin [Bdellovibrionota bacterium FG-2]